MSDTPIYDRLAEDLHPDARDSLWLLDGIKMLKRAQDAYPWIYGD